MKCNHLIILQVFRKFMAFYLWQRAGLKLYFFNITYTVLNELDCKDLDLFGDFNFQLSIPHSPKPHSPS